MSAASLVFTLPGIGSRAMTTDRGSAADGLGGSRR